MYLIMYMKPPNVVIMILNVGFVYTWFIRLPNQCITMYHSYTYEAPQCVIRVHSVGYTYLTTRLQIMLSLCTIVYNQCVKTLNSLCQCTINKNMFVIAMYATIRDCLKPTNQYSKCSRKIKARMYTNNLHTFLYIRTTSKWYQWHPLSLNTSSVAPA